MSTDELLATFPIRYETPVAWGEMDAFKHVNNAVYFRYFESARIAYFQALGFDAAEGIGPILHSTSARFRLPLTFPDQVIVGARVRDVGEDRFTMLYRVVSRRLEAVAAEGEGIVVCYDYRAACKAKLPAAIVARIAELDPESAAATEGGSSG